MGKESIGSYINLTDQRPSHWQMPGYLYARDGNRVEAIRVWYKTSGQKSFTLTTRSHKPNITSKHVKCLMYIRKILNFIKRYLLSKYGKDFEITPSLHKHIKQINYFATLLSHKKPSFTLFFTFPFLRVCNNQFYCLLYTQQSSTWLNIHK